jgi:transcriptional antiterminator
MENDEKILLALMSSGTIAEAAKRCDLSERTIYRRLADEEFRTEWRSARRSLVEGAIGLMQTGMSRAVQTLFDSLDDAKYPAIRVRAAKIIIENSQKSLETFDAIERIEKLEKLFEVKNAEQ